MKRSEMIKQIKACFRATDHMVKYQNGEISLGRCAEDLSKNIIDHIESIGMLPPFNKNIKESKVGYGAAYLSDEEVRLRYIRHFCKWEPEDV